MTIDKDLFLAQRKREFLQQQYFNLYENYVVLVASLDFKDAELTEAKEKMEALGKEFSDRESDLLTEINRISQEYMELAIKNKHLERELNAWEKGKKKSSRVTNTRKKTVVSKESKKESEK